MLSVLHLRLSSVMCVPLREGGNLLGRFTSAPAR